MKRHFRITMFSMVAALTVSVGFAGYTEMAERLADKLEAKVADRTVEQQVEFYNMAIGVLGRYTRRHPVIPLIIDELKEMVYEIEGLAVTNNANVTYDIDNVDMERVRATRLGWVNEARAKKGLDPFSRDPSLDKTALERSDTLGTRHPTLQRERPAGGTHWRNSSSEGYYNFNVITKWFEDRGIDRKVTENNFYRGYSCSSNDCTDALLTSMRKGFDFFMNEGPGGPHHDTQMSSEYSKVGMGLTHERGFKIRAVFHVAE